MVVGDEFHFKLSKEDIHGLLSSYLLHLKEPYPRRDEIYISDGESCTLKIA